MSEDSNISTGHRILTPKLPWVMSRVEGGLVAPLDSWGRRSSGFSSGSVGVGGGTYDFPFNTATNNVGGGGQGGGGLNNNLGGGLGANAGGGAFINPALKGGFNRIQMIRTDYDSLVGVFFNPLTVRFTETVLTNDRPRSQSLTRTVTQPDIIFDAADLQGEATAVFTPYNTPGAAGWNSSDGLDGVTGDDFGPGVIVPPFRITFNTVGPLYTNLVSSNAFFLMKAPPPRRAFSTGGLLTDQPMIRSFIRWGPPYWN